jgi:hypothetical protein
VREPGDFVIALDPDAARLGQDASGKLFGEFFSLQILLGYLGNGFIQVGKPQSSDEGTSQPETARNPADAQHR